MTEALRSCVHTHTTFCDGASTPEETVQAALGLGFVSLGFSGHGAAAYDDAAMTPAAEVQYRREILRLQAAYAGQLELLLGQEHDALSPYAGYPYDYLIESVHYLRHQGDLLCVDLSRADTEAHIRRFGDPYAYCRAYFETCAAAYEKSPANIAGHLDLVSKFNGAGDLFDEADPRYLGPAREALAVAVERGLAVEVNTGAMARGYRPIPYPAPALLRTLRELGGRVILTSDCHDAARLTYGYAEALALLRAEGFRTALVLRASGFQETAL